MGAVRKEDTLDRVEKGDYFDYRPSWRKASQIRWLLDARLYMLNERERQGRLREGFVPSTYERDFGWWTYWDPTI